MRDIISHHYEGLDHEIIFSICNDKLKDLKTSVIDILNTFNDF
ncbi:HepT-like ribonuclease domain-containing protein [Leptospira licerasiae]|nr:HepT-like ribonuclease domain-containing protein [Leptospira licerasiae]